MNRPWKRNVLRSHFIDNGKLFTFDSGNGTVIQVLNREGKDIYIVVYEAKKIRKKSVK